MGVIYKITTPTNRVYVGKTCNLKRRISDYKYKLNNLDSIIIGSIKKYGWDAHKIEVIEDDLPDEKLDEREIFWIAELKTYWYDNPMGCNLTKGGEGQRSTWIHDTERRKKQSEKFSGSGNPFFGKRHTDEYKIKASIREKFKSIINERRIPEWGAEKGRNKIRRAILCYDANGVFVREFNSIIDVENNMGLNHSCVHGVCNGTRTHAGWYIFRYKTENYPLKIEVGKLNEPVVKKPIVCSYKNKITEYNSPEDASNDTGVPRTTIRRAARYNNGKPIRTGHIFKYK